jgi:hypothetical protein
MHHGIIYFESCEGKSRESYVRYAKYVNFDLAKQKHSIMKSSITQATPRAMIVKMRDSMCAIKKQTILNT